ncbi:MAG TPA: teichuronic acid biosynthesis glycosyl transferase [Bacteroidales bacterium]|nr:teichuronic acid biosynthesis glycosyl transferase [Bacteroidales bacterium]
MQDNLVSIVTPLYNGEKFVRQTIESVLAQTYPEWEMLIVNDGSKDRSEEIALEYARKDHRIHVFSQANGGSASARNHGIREAKGRYMVFLDADDYWDPTFLEDQLRFMNAKNASIVAASCRRVDENGKEVLRPLIVPNRMNYRDLLKTCSLPCLTTMIDRSTFRDVYFHEELRSLRDDYVLWLSLLKQTDYAYGNPKVLASYRLNLNGATANKRKMIKPQFLVYYRVEKLGLIRSLYYLAHWAVNGFLKYRK